MNLWHKSMPKGDTLIEVIFAFAILATIIGFAYSGSIQARKSALSAQQRTQALQVAQYQSQALKTYRYSLPWDGSTGEFPNFLNTGLGGGTPLNETTKYCVFPTTSGISAPRLEWRLLANNDPGCTALVTNILPQLPDPALPDTKMSISFKKGKASCVDLITCDSVQGEVTVAWTDPYNITTRVQDIVILTKAD